MPKERQLIAQPGRSIVVQGLSFVEDVVYIGLGVLLTIASVTLLWVAAKTFVIAIVTRQLQGQVVGLLDQILLILLIVELLYTVQVSFRAHGLLAEPFLVVALIAVIRRILVLTAEVPKLPEAGDVVFRHTLLELSLLTVMVLVLVGSLILLQKYSRLNHTIVFTAGEKSGLIALPIATKNDHLSARRQMGDVALPVDLRLLPLS